MVGGVRKCGWRRRSWDREDEATKWGAGERDKCGSRELRSVRCGLGFDGRRRVTVDSAPQRVLASPSGGERGSRRWADKQRRGLRIKFLLW